MSEPIFSRILFFCFVWVWGVKIAHYTWGFGFVWFFGLGYFSLAVCVWGDGLVHTVMMDCMLGSVGVVWGYVKFFLWNTSFGQCCRGINFGFLVKTYDVLFVLFLESFLFKKWSKLGKEI